MSVLLPLVDIANHQPLAKVEWQAGRENIGFVVMEDIAAGQEIGNNYGPRDNGQCTCEPRLSRISSLY
jgi:SET domain